MWNDALAGVRKHLITYSKTSHLTVLGELPDGIGKPLSPKMDHLVCFMPGTIALGATGGLTEAEARASGNWGPKQEEEMKLARELTQTCWGMYKVTRTGLAPEIAHFSIDDPPLMEKDHVKPLQGLSDREDADWRADYVVKSNDAHNLQRPETVESLFYMWRLTGDEMYRHWGWEMFKAFVKHTDVGGGGGFTSLGNVNEMPPPQRDNMESFWLVSNVQQSSECSPILTVFITGRDAQVLLSPLLPKRPSSARPGRHQHGSTLFPSLRAWPALLHWLETKAARCQWQDRARPVAFTPPSQSFIVVSSSAFQRLHLLIAVLYHQNTLQGGNRIRRCAVCCRQPMQQICDRYATDISLC